ncbi:small ribosomal subunit protein bS21c isoform X3 [Solanum lycopersicum]|uniref:small ribosomal subunit protein bS21c isoform X3 n=1 Tax=Solanum lycopersicum TaxID=4081 RepID=UPI0002BC9325|nr:30S ribosomal protein S21, chloroplastic isoform X3 [Solanum lycopersicum]
MALFQSSSFFNPLLSSSNNQNTANFRPKTAQISTVRAVPLCVSSTSLPVVAGEHEPEEKLIGRFRREVFRAGVIQESKRRRFFESTQEKKKRKCRDAARRNRKRRPQPKALLGDTPETLKDEGYKSDEDKWDLIDVESPYT